MRTNIQRTIQRHIIDIKQTNIKTDKMKVIKYTAETLQALKTAYNKAKETNAQTFKHNHAEYVTEYAKYLIEYIEMKLNEFNKIRSTNTAETTA